MCRVRTISNIFTLQTTSQYEQCGQRQREETLGRSSWNVNVYCMRAGSCEDKPGYLRGRRQRCFDGPSCRVADDVFIMRARTMHDKPVCPESV